MQPSTHPRLRSNIPWLACAVSIACSTLISKLSVPPFADRGIPIALFLLPITALSGLALRAFHLDPARLAFFLLLVGILSVTSIFGAAEPSIGSLAMMIAVPLPFVFAPQVTASHSCRADSPLPSFDTAGRIHGLFLDLALVIACCGIGQFFLQPYIEPRFLFPIENFVPSSLVIQHFNSQGVVEYGSQTYRANGVFLPEPSHFSQLMAIALVLELSFRNRWHRLGIYVAALLCAVAGTGLMILAVCIPVLIVKRSRWDLLLVAAAALGLLAALGESSHPGHLTSRAGEFNAVGSSGFARFIGGFYLFDQFLWEDPWRTLFGFGAGSFTELASRAHYPVAEMPVFKMVAEYGVAGALLYFGLLGYFLFSSRAPGLLSLAIAISFLLNGIYGAFAQALALGLLVWPYASTHGGESSV